ncbi:MAG TPA: hypothetical protein VFD91_04150 [Mariniphaga sp.]|nr:hypothetical protein [Mariniphaga sp.]
MKFVFKVVLFLIIFSCSDNYNKQTGPRQVSGIYPHLAYYNNEGECGTGAVVPWAGRLWMITYGPHLPFGSSDKLYEITPDLEQIVHTESIGGTPANRMIHKESDQLFIGPYVIDNERNIRVIPYEQMPGRHTGNARHLTDPANKLYYGTMEEGFYEVDINSLDVNLLYEDLNVTNKKEKDEAANIPSSRLMGVHGKGLYSGQGVMVYSNNGESGPLALEQFDIEAGSLSEWDGKEWKLVRRNQFVEVTGPGGIHGNENPETDPIWTTGWDHKSIIVGVRNYKVGWQFYRLPKASHSYDGAHGWNTEWPRIRNIGTDSEPDYLMTMHGMFWKFPNSFDADNSSGIRPRSAYLKVIGDFTRWNDQLVFGCDDSAQKEFLNKRKHKGNIEGPGQSNSNLWFTPLDIPDKLGPATASGAVWLNDKVKEGEFSEPFLFEGWKKRSAWIHNSSSSTTDFLLEIDENGNGNWKELKKLSVGANNSEFVEFDENTRGEWIRVQAIAPTIVTVCFNYTDEKYPDNSSDAIFNGLATINESISTGGLLYGLGDNRRVLGISAVVFEGDTASSIGYYELDENLNLIRKDDPETDNFIKEKFAIPENVITIDSASVLIIDDKNRRWRLPMGADNYKNLTDAAQLRICREVATERDLFNACGTFYELPAENADGFAKIRPISSHQFKIHDYASYRGMLVMTGLQPIVNNGEHIVTSEDGNAAVWLGVIDDLWKMGKPVGTGGPWNNTSVKADEPSDPYLIGFYNERSLELSHNASKPVTFKIEVEPIGHGPWMLYKEVTVQPGETFNRKFSENFQARWIRFISDTNCKASAWLTYN